MLSAHPNAYVGTNKNHKRFEIHEKKDHNSVLEQMKRENLRKKREEANVNKGR